MNTTQQRFKGFLNTPVLWKDSEVYYLTQFKIEQELLSFDQVIDSNQRLGKYVEKESLMKELIVLDWASKAQLL